MKTSVTASTINKFLEEVRELALKNNLNYFVVTDGKSETHNRNNKDIHYISNAFEEYIKNQEEKNNEKI